MSRRLLIVCVLGLCAAVVRFAFYPQGNSGGSDFFWSVRAAQDVLAGRDPYAYAPSAMFIPYPLPALFVGLPFAWLPAPLIGPLFVGLSSALLAWGLTRDGEYWRLLTFVSAPYLMAVKTAQWSPLFFALLLLPALTPLTLVKPTLALPILLETGVTMRRVLGAALLLITSLLIMPLWPLRWLSQTTSYAGFVPLLTLPFGGLLLLAAWRWRDPRARFLLAMACVPQHRMLYDQLLLWHLPRSRREMLFLSTLSWGACFLALTILDFRYGDVLAVLWIYLPALGLVLYPHLRARRRAMLQATNS